MSDNGQRERLPRGVKRDANYAVLNTGQLIPDESSPERPSHKKRFDPNALCVWCQQHDDVRHCSNCNKLYHDKCVKAYDPSMNNLCGKCTPRSARHRLAIGTTMKDVVKLLEERKNIIVLVGAGISVSCGIPDFRSENGIYSIIQKMGLNLPEPEALFDIDFFRVDPFPFFHFAMDFFKGSYTPSRTHRFLKELYDKGKLLRVYSQNIDGLEKDAGVPNVVSCHGTLATASCMRCQKNVPTANLKLEEVVAAQGIPLCDCGGVMKPDITFFGQALSPKIRESLIQDAPKVDLLIVIGTSLQVSPVSDIPAYLPRSVPQILINMESVVARGTEGFDIELLGACDTVVEYMHQSLASEQVDKEPHFHEPHSYCFGDSCYWIDDEKEAYEDESFMCDGCGQEISCEKIIRLDSTCFDYDLCAHCHNSDDIKNAHCNGTHEFSLQ
ncbi:hypothetical protein THRCLA_07322 [Thraustotheca clavata]|uniref:Deacetylase sirtuin-type domain-containing protein n=1 Tax=Thraustotheca clavata TaxID=74557 RepID=A0A1V9ZEP8_9STRA|nr:hypothetical protein THRCLA_07322 [Thraustotheca clavata]